MVEVGRCRLDVIDIVTVIVIIDVNLDTLGTLVFERRLAIGLKQQIVVTTVGLRQHLVTQSNIQAVTGVSTDDQRFDWYTVCESNGTGRQTGIVLRFLFHAPAIRIIWHEIRALA